MTTRTWTDEQADDALAAVRRTCLSLPETTERLSHGAPCFFVRDKKTFVYFHDDHHGDGILGIWCAAPQVCRSRWSRPNPSGTTDPPTSAIAGGSASDSTSTVTTTNSPR